MAETLPLNISVRSYTESGEINDREDTRLNEVCTSSDCIEAANDSALSNIGDFFESREDSAVDEGVSRGDLVRLFDEDNDESCDLVRDLVAQVALSQWLSGYMCTGPMVSFFGLIVSTNNYVVH